MGDIERFLRAFTRLAMATAIVFFAAALLTPPATAESGLLHKMIAWDAPDIVVLALLAIPAAWLYCLPSVVAERRAHKQRLAIAAMNLLLGATFIFWVLALVWALTEDNRAAAATPAVASGVFEKAPSAAELAIRETAAERGRAVGGAIARGLLGGMKR